MSKCDDYLVAAKTVLSPEEFERFEFYMGHYRLITSWATSGKLSTASYPAWRRLAEFLEGEMRAIYPPIPLVPRNPL